jgi:hypothetical protein
MHGKLKWKAIRLVRKTQLLRDYIQNENDEIPINHASKHIKRQRYLDKRIMTETVIKLKNMNKKYENFTTVKFIKK